jgi:ribulose-5-phosphate 4-epimerase/fuculose-1-phosphate aldolase
MKFAVVGNGEDAVRDTVAAAVVTELERRGHERAPADNGVKFVVNLIDVETPRPFHRRSQTVFVVSLATIARGATGVRSTSYHALVRSFSNLMLCVVPPNGSHGDGASAPEIYFTTPEVGFYHYPFEPGRVCDSILPIVGSRLAIDNRITADLPEAYWGSTPVVEAIKRFGGELDRLGVLPTPFPLREVLGERDIEHVYRMYGITGLSYGNLSAREYVPEIGESTFWMTARGVNKARLVGVGTDVMLVTGYDESTGEILVSVPPEHCEKARVSVDAVEHELIYRTFPAVGAIVHAHAWMDGVPCTRQNYPCGTRDLAEEVVRLLAETPHPEHAVLGLKNHGLTITGPSLQDIFSRIRGRLRTEVPMFA